MSFYDHINLLKIMYTKYNNLSTVICGKTWQHQRSVSLGK